MLVHIQTSHHPPLRRGLQLHVVGADQHRPVHIDQPVTVATVSEQEMGRLSYAAGPNPYTYPVARRRRYPQTYPGPYGYPYGPYYGRY